MMISSLWHDDKYLLYRTRRTTRRSADTPRRTDDYLAVQEFSRDLAEECEGVFRPYSLPTILR